MKTLWLNLPVRQKLTLSFILFIATAALPSYLYLEEKSNTIAFNQLQIEGNELITSIYHIISPIQVTRGQTNGYLSGKLEFKESILKKRKQAILAFEQTIKLAQSNNDTFSAVNTLLSIQEHYLGINEAAFTASNKAEIFSAYSEVVSDLQQAIYTLSDKSNLSIDYETTTKSLINIITIDSHNIVEYMGKLRGLGAGIIPNGITPDESKKIQKLAELSGAARFNAYSERLKKIINDNNSISKSNIDLINDSTNKVNTFFNEVTHIVGNHQARVDSATYFKLGTDAINSVYMLTHSTSKELNQLLSNRLNNYKKTIYSLFLFIALTAIISITVALLSFSSITGGLKKITDILNRITSGNLDNRIERLYKDEISTLLKVVLGMQSTLKKNIHQIKDEAQKSKKVTVALDSSSTAIMILDQDRSIQYANSSMMKLLETCKKRSALNIDNLIGTSFEQLTAQDAVQVNSLNVEDKTLNAETITVGDITILSKLSDVHDSEENVIGEVIEWTDISSQVNIESEIDEMIKSVNDGNLKSRLSLKNRSGFYASLSKDLNSFLDMIESFFSDINQIMFSLSRGDLTKTIDTEYFGQFGELQKSCNDTIYRLNDIVIKLNENGSELVADSNDIARGNEELNNRTQHQAGRIEEIASSLEEISATAAASTDKISQLYTFATDVNQNSNEGAELLDQSIDAMSSIETSSDKIKEIVHVIGEISFQTNLLALNAAVEAARAGDAGRGFSVVATEVRALAQRTAESAKEITALINESAHQVQSGSTLVKTTSDAFKTIIASVVSVSNMVKEINEAAEEQNRGINYIGEATTSLETMTQKNSAFVEEINASSSQISSKAKELSDIISFFKQA